MRNSKIIIVAIIALSLSIISFCFMTCQDDLSKSIDCAGLNKKEIVKSINYFPNGTDKKRAMFFLIKNMLYQKSYNDSIGKILRDSLIHNNAKDATALWNQMAKECPEPQIEYDLKCVKADYLIKNVNEAFETWKNSAWHDEIDFLHFCRYILPYKVDKEPLSQWRKYLRNKYAFLVKDIHTEKEAFIAVFSYLKDKFKVKRNGYPYEKDPILLDLLGGGDCKARAVYMVYVMRALGIAAAFDYTPYWANYGDNSHSWAVMVDNKDSVFTGIDSLSYYIDGAYERSKYFVEKEKYIYSIDSLKKIAKVHRVNFHITDYFNIDKNVPYLFRSPYDEDVTLQYPNNTKDNIVETKQLELSNLYLCTFKQKDGWVPVSKLPMRFNKKIDVGGLIHDCLIIVAKYEDGIMIPVSQPHIINHYGKPKKLEPVEGKKQSLTLYRKYMFANRWTNRWGDFLETKIETSTKENFDKDKDLLFQCNSFPTEVIKIPLDSNKIKRYIRIIPKEGKFPVFAEINLYDSNKKEIMNKNFRVYSIGEGLTGDTLVTRSLIDGDEATTFFKQFPFWIGLDLKDCRHKIGCLELTMWNDYNRIIKGHVYELFFFDYGWKSLGRKIADNNFLKYNNIPVGCLFLLRDFSHGKEERVFTYEGGKQIWW